VSLAHAVHKRKLVLNCTVTEPQLGSDEGQSLFCVQAVH
jgi:hypothetical protein